MPELPEVEATRRNLEAWTGKRTIAAVEVLDDKLAIDVSMLLGQRVDRWERRGKTLIARVGDAALYLHLGMTGKVVRDPQERLYQRMRLTVSGPEKRNQMVAFIDPRRFGDARTLTHAEADAALAALGPDALDSPLDARELKAAMGRGKTAVKARLLEQHRLAGLGNIAVVEACYRAKVHPHTPVSDVDDATWAALVPAIREHLQATLASIEPEVELTYLSEGAESEFLVYGHADRPCGRCGTRIAREVLAGRPTFFCPKCQPL